MLKKNWLVALFMMLTASLSLAVNNSDLVIKRLKTYLPDLQIDQIHATNIQNIYEVVSRNRIFYIDNSGRYLFLGNLVDLTTKTSITQTRIESIASTANAWNILPLNIAIIRTKGNGKRKLAVFTDPDCPYCKRLEIDVLSKLDNVTIYYFLFPLIIHANANNDAKK
jgi:thiol:disulfide interchange protein DsbC